MFGASLLCFYKKSDDEQIPPKILSVNFHPALFFLDFLTFEDAAERLSQKGYHSMLRIIPEERRSHVMTW
jgi:hypothetical protein